MFTSIKKRKELIDREVELYKKEKFLETDKAIEDYRAGKNRQIEDLAKRCQEDTATYEHVFHSTMEVRGVEIAKLEAKNEALAVVVKAREEVIKADNNLLQSKETEITRLNSIVTALIKEMPKHTTIIQPPK